MVSFIGGLMLGIAVFHLIPHSEDSGLDSIHDVMWWTMMGMLTTFFLLRVFQFHHHGTLDEEEDDHSHEGHHCHIHEGPSSSNWFGVLCGLSAHTIIDGIALSASVASGGAIAGFGVFAAILLHKPLDALSITSLMRANNFAKNKIRAVNVIFALLCPASAILFYLGLIHVTGIESTAIGIALAFSAGVFLCISLGDLLPELSFHSHDRFVLSISLLLGIAAAYSIGLLESGHFAHHH